MSVKSLALDLCCDADGCVLSLSAAMASTGSVYVAGALVSDWPRIVEYVGSRVSPVDISYTFGARSACEVLALSTLLHVERL